MHRKQQRKQQRIKQVELNGLHIFMVAFHVIYVCCFVESCEPQNKKKNRIEYMLSKGVCYTSSEKSDTHSDGRKTLRQNSLPWLKKKYAKSFRQLDEQFVNEE